MALADLLPTYSCVWWAPNGMPGDTTGLSALRCRSSLVPHWMTTFGVAGSFTVWSSALTYWSAMDSPRTRRTTEATSTSTATTATARVIGLVGATPTACQARHRGDRPLSHFGGLPHMMNGAFVHLNLDPPMS